MLTIEERNNIARDNMRARFHLLLDQDAEMTKQNVCDYTKAVFMLNNVLWFTEEDLKSLPWFLLAKVDYSNPGDEPNNIPRYDCICNYIGGIENAVRDWNNQSEMGK